MKPRIRFRQNVWDCRLPDFLTTRVIGYGFNPTEAFENWKQERRKAIAREQAQSPAGPFVWRNQ